MTWRGEGRERRNTHTIFRAINSARNSISIEFNLILFHKNTEELFFLSIHEYFSSFFFWFSYTFPIEKKYISNPEWWHFNTNYTIINDQSTRKITLKTFFSDDFFFVRKSIYYYFFLFPFVSKRAQITYIKFIAKVFFIGSKSILAISKSCVMIWL